MATHRDYEALRAHTMGAGNDEAVTVNTRALIDKVLARYSGEWTTLRELLQNAADASATKVIIRYQTLPSATIPVPQSSHSSSRLKHVLLHHTLRSLTVENNGVPFMATDWSRLKKIAEGNPDETKIGAFGVGFYSVFADCEEPFVSSGNEALAFYWKGDSLFTKTLRLNSVQSANTTFVLPMRNSTSPIPSLLSLAQFLTSSLTFVGLESIELWLDDWRILELDKIIAPSTVVDMPQDLDKRTRGGLMNVKSVTQNAAQLHARWLKVVEWDPKATSLAANTGQGSGSKAPNSAHSLRTFFSRLAPGAGNAAAEKAASEELAKQTLISEDLMGEDKDTIFLHVNKADIGTTVSKAFSDELERATKKPPPKTTTVSLLTVSYDEHIVSTSEQHNQPSKTTTLFSSVLPTKGKVFIGFPTNQTTGLNAHISTPSVIPTVERESIDLNNQFIRAWNVELLRVAGILVRVAWNYEMANLKRKLSRQMLASGRKDINHDDLTRILPEAIYLHKAFNFIESTPLSEVGNLIEEAFWTCNKNMSIDILSSRGVMPSSSVRVSVEDLGFVDRIPTLPTELAGFGLVKRLREYGVITDITIADLKSELEEKALNVSQLQRFLEWIGNKARNKELEGGLVRSLLSVAVANDEEGGSGRLVVLGDIKTYLNPSRIPADMPVPLHTIPFKFIKKMNSLDLIALGWEDLQMLPWLRWLILEGHDYLKPEQDFQASTSFAKAVLPVISKQWDGLTSASKTSVIELLTPRTIIPTKIGMKKPAESYFPSVNLFEDLPVISSLQSVKEKFLIALGVRKTIEIGVVFDRLMATSTDPGGQAAGKWSHVDLIKYLSSVHSDIPSVDIKRLQTTRICVAEGDSAKASERYLVSDLFEPDESLRLLKLPILQWPGDYNSSSPQGRFLTSLGLRAFPTYLELVNIMANTSHNQDVPLRNHAFKYFIDNYNRKGYDIFDHTSIRVPYLPLQGQDTLGTPTDCFTNDCVAMLGFNVLNKGLHAHASKFGVQANPPIQECVKRLVQSPPNSKRRARELFEYFAGRLNEITRQQSDMLNDTPIVPVLSKYTKSGVGSEKSEVARLVPPRLCFLGSDEKYEAIFDYVDFGQEANAFLLRCGSKHEPSGLDLAKILVKEPAKIFTQLGISKYSELLMNLAESWSNLRKDWGLVTQMKTAKFLLAFRELPGQTENQLDDDENYQDVKTAELASADQIVVIDDMITYNQFKAGLLTAPPEVVLENFYSELGASDLASLVEEYHGIGALARDQKIASQLQKLIEERVRLYLYDVPQDLIKNNASWVEKHLSVVLVESISLRKTLRGHNRVHKESRSAAVNIARGAYTLSVTAKFDMFEVSQVLVPLLLRRHKTQHTMMLEMILSTDLRKLQSRGYNVQRILRQQAAEARIAEEARKRQLAQEAQEIKETEARWNKQKAQDAAHTQGPDPMPGVFPDSPDRFTRPPQVDPEWPNQTPRGFFSGLGKKLGFEKGRNSALQIKAGEGNVGGTGTSNQTDSPPPYSLQDEQKSGRQATQAETVTAPHRLHQNLVNAIQASRAHNSSDITSQPAVNVVKETHSYCDAKPGQNLTHVGTTGSLQIFLAKTVISTSPSSVQDFLQVNASSLSSFGLVLLDCAEVFGMKGECIHIFYDETGSTIAFNQDKALFFNYRYFQNLHLSDVREGKRSDAVVYWFVVMAHELAHNLIADHSADHSYYTEALVIQYFSKISAKISPRIPDAPSQPQTLTLPRRGVPPSLLDID